MTDHGLDDKGHSRQRQGFFTSPYPGQIWDQSSLLSNGWRGILPCGQI